MMKKLLEIGEYYVSDFIATDDTSPRHKHGLDLYLDETIGAPRLKDVVDPSEMYGRYWYRSGTNSTMTLELKHVVDEITKRISYTTGDVWLDIACNDGTMFKHIPTEFVRLGIDPADDTFYNESSKLANVAQEFFSADSFNKLSGGKKAKVVTTIAMFYDLDNPHTFIQDVASILEDDGVWVLQMSYTPLMVKQMAFDNICHEHIYYYALKDISKLMSMNGMTVVDCSFNETNGGSFRIYVVKQGHENKFSTQPVRDVCSLRMQSVLAWEAENYDASDVGFWQVFGERINSLKEQTVSFIKEEVAKGKVIYGYGASTKGNTLLQHFGLDNTLITAIAERSPYKFGRTTVGTNIPIVSEEEMRKANPDYLLVLPWHFIAEFKQRETDFINAGGKLIVPCPTFEVIGK